MTASTEDIAAGTREATIGSWQDDALHGRYPGARDALTPPAEGFFDVAADAQTAANQRGALIGVERRRFSVPINDVVWFDPVAGLPTVRLVDALQLVDRSCLIARIEVDLETDTTSLELFG